MNPLQSSMVSLQSSMVSLLVQHGFLHTDVNLLQPIDAFLDLSGETIRRRLYLTSDADGLELCLRPEYTIPVARDYIASDIVGQRAEFCYCGSVFRHRTAESGEFMQAGVESFGRPDLEATDGETLNLAFETAKVMGLKNPKIRIGDIALIKAVLSALNVPLPQHRKVLRLLASNEAITEAFDVQKIAESSGLSAYNGVLTALKGAEPAEARAFVKDLLSIAGINSVGGRSTADIATRFLAQSETIDTALNDQSRLILDYFLSLEGNPDHVSLSLRKIAKDAKLDLNAVLDKFDIRVGFIAASGLDIDSLHCQTGFVRSLEYYSSFIFEIDSQTAQKPALAGGRYDRLLGQLGAREDIPAIGFSAWLNRGTA